MKDICALLIFPKLNKFSELKIAVFPNASMGNINDGTGSVRAFIVWLMDNTGQCCPIALSTHKIKWIVNLELTGGT